MEPAAKHLLGGFCQALGKSLVTVAIMILTLHAFGVYVAITDNPNFNGISLAAAISMGTGLFWD